MGIERGNARQDKITLADSHECIESSTVFNSSQWPVNPKSSRFGMEWPATGNGAFVQALA